MEERKQGAAIIIKGTTEQREIAKRLLDQFLQKEETEEFSLNDEVHSLVYLRIFSLRAILHLCVYTHTCMDILIA